MKFLIQGTEGNVVQHLLTGDTTFNVQLLNDDGSPLSIASPAVVTIEYFSGKVRTDTPITAKTVTPGAGAAAGFGTLVISDLDVVPPRNTYYLWARYSSNGGTGAGATVLIANVPAQIQVL